MQKFLRITDPESAQITALELNQCTFMLAFLEKLPASQVVNRPDITYATSGIQDTSVNYVCRTRATPETIKDLVADVHVYFRQDEMPFAWWVGPSSQPKNLGAMLTKQGMILEDDEIGMILDLDRHEDESVESDGLEIQRCLNAELMRDFGYVHQSMSDSTAQSELWARMVQAPLSEQEPLEFYVGYANGEPVTTGILFLRGGVAGLYYIATVPEERGKGYGSAMVKFLLSRSQGLGYHVAVLCAPSMSVNFYKNLGFRPLCMFQVYTMQWDR